MRGLSRFSESRRLVFCSPYFWKKIFLYKRHSVFKSAEKLVYSRSSVVPKTIAGTSVKIYSGRSWYHRIVNKWMVGFKFGEFTWNRRYATYKSKQLKKKKKKK